MERIGFLEKLAKATPDFILKGFGVSSLGIFAFLQISLISFAAPIATLALMSKNGSSSKHLASALAMVLGAAQANILFPMTALGLNLPVSMCVSFFCGMIGASITFHWLTSHLHAADCEIENIQCINERMTQDTIAKVITRAVVEAFNIMLKALPVLVIALLVVSLLQAVGLIDFISDSLFLLLAYLDLSNNTVVIVLTKFIAGATPMMGVVNEFLDQGLINSSDINKLGGLIISPYDITGIAIFASISPRVAGVLKPAMLGGGIVVILRTIAQYTIVS